MRSVEYRRYIRVMLKLISATSDHLKSIFKLHVESPQWRLHHHFSNTFVTTVNFRLDVICTVSHIKEDMPKVADALKLGR